MDYGNINSSSTYAKKVRDKRNEIKIRNLLRKTKKKLKPTFKIGGEVKPIDLVKVKKELQKEFNLQFKNIDSKFQNLNNSVDELRIRIARGGRRKKRTRRRKSRLKTRRKLRRRKRSRKRRKSRRKRKR